MAQALRDRYVIISADCHAAPTDEQIRPYFEQRHQSAFDDLVSQRTSFVSADAEGLGLDPELLKRFQTLHQANWDSAFRMEKLESDGIVGEVIFPNPGDGTGCPPFQGVQPGPDGGPYPFELQLAGARAYNRWLADFCSEYPDRQAGIAMVPPFYEIEPVVEEITRARESGLRGGIMLPLIRHRLAGYNHRRYDPIWAACADLDIPLNAHALNGEADDPIVYGDGPDAFSYVMFESGFFSRRALWFFIWGGVFDRHPTLKLVFTEQFADWVPVDLAHLDSLHGSPFMAAVASTLELTPSEYWKRNCWVGATFMTPAESEMRNAIGIENIMWGSDFPHPEGTFPYTTKSLRKIYGGVSSDEVAPMLGENAAAVYGFDIDALQPLADKIGPRIADVAVPLPDDELPTDHMGLGFN